MRTLRTIAVARAHDEGTYEVRGKWSAASCHLESSRRSNERSQQAVEAPLRRELAPASCGEPPLDAAPAVCQHVEGGESGQLAPANGEAHAVARHGIDKSSRVPRQKQPVWNA